MLSLLSRRTFYQLIRPTSQTSCRYLLLHTTGVNREIFDFFDDQTNWGKQSSVRATKRPGRSWTVDELRLKSNTDLHKLWYVLLVERNMLLTMEEAYKSSLRIMPNPERIDLVEESMERLETVVHERNNDVLLMETGVSADPPKRTVTSFMGFRYEKPLKEYAMPAYANPTGVVKEYEQPYLDDDAYMMQKLWAEKEWWKRRNAEDDQLRWKKLKEIEKTNAYPKAFTNADYGRPYRKSARRLINHVNQLK